MHLVSLAVLIYLLRLCPCNLGRISFAVVIPLSMLSTNVVIVVYVVNLLCLLMGARRFGAWGRSGWVTTRFIPQCWIDQHPSSGSGNGRRIRHRRMMFSFCTYTRDPICKLVLLPTELWRIELLNPRLGGSFTRSLGERGTTCR